MDAYPASLRAVHVVLGDAVKVVVRSFPTASPELLSVFQTVPGTRDCSLVLTDAAGLLKGQHIQIGVHSLEVQLRAELAGTDTNCPASCLLDWVAQSRATSVLLQAPARDDLQRVIMLKASVDNHAGAYHSVEYRVLARELFVVLSHSCAWFGLTCTEIGDDGTALLRRNGG